ncbi:hypothetical protein E2C01_054566 [Portunus trituberculatus]|uniref:Uncharacterized protein n=1 Tax=Portunus trituberculatus TaxID=210409 RepID=A0A5B7GJY7_PORTR|nr:hypothetical protein [Portunus trituberculatus]
MIGPGIPEARHVPSEGGGLGGKDRAPRSERKGNEELHLSIVLLLLKRKEPKAPCLREVPLAGRAWPGFDYGFLRAQDNHVCLSYLFRPLPVSSFPHAGSLASVLSRLSLPSITYSHLGMWLRHPAHLKRSLKFLRLSFKSVTAIPCTPPPRFTHSQRKGIQSDVIDVLSQSCRASEVSWTNQRVRRVHGNQDA